MKMNRDIIEDDKEDSRIMLCAIKVVWILIAIDMILSPKLFLTILLYAIS